MVLSRPQEDSSTVTLSSMSFSATDKSAEIPIRYKLRSSSNLSSFVSPVALSFSKGLNLFNTSYVLNTSNQENVIKSNINEDIFYFKNNVDNINISNRNKNHTRRSRLLSKNLDRLNLDVANRAYKSIPKLHLNEQNHIASDNFFSEKNKPIIRKVVTKWTDKTKYEDLDFRKENFDIADDERNENSKELYKYNSREDMSSDVSELSKDNHPKLTKKVYYKPRPQNNQPFPTYTSNIQPIDSYSYNPTRPTYVFATPTPTPVVTNVGYPSPWPQQNFQVYQPVTTQRPIRVTHPVRDYYNHHSVVNNYPQQYPGDKFEVTTFQPTSAYTDRIVIRPEEYSASPDDCPTIYLTLNNTFQGQGKEACPDLNIAVNTNVVNKNVVVESEEESDNPFADAFGIPLMDDSESAEAANDYNESSDDEANAESASIEATALTNYNANAAAQESAEPGSFGSPSSALSTVSRPERPSDDDDVFSFSSIINFFKPALSALNWLAAINPLSFGIISFILTPIAILFAGASGLAALFAPLALTYAREAPTALRVANPYWAWNGNGDSKMYQDISLDTTTWAPIMNKLGNFENVPNNQQEPSIKPTLFYRFKEWMKSVTQKLISRKRSSDSNNIKNKRKKRETWTSTVK